MSPGTTDFGRHPWLIKARGPFKFGNGGLADFLQLPGPGITLFDRIGTKLLDILVRLAGRLLLTL